MKLELQNNLHGSGHSTPDMLALNDALDELSALDERKARIVEMRYFGGLTGEEIAECMALSTATVTRELCTDQAAGPRSCSPVLPSPSRTFVS